MSITPSRYAVKYSETDPILLVEYMYGEQKRHRRIHLKKAYNFEKEVSKNFDELCDNIYWRLSTQHEEYLTSKRQICTLLKNILERMPLEDRLRPDHNHSEKNESKKNTGRFETISDLELSTSDENLSDISFPDDESAQIGEEEEQEGKLAGEEQEDFDKEGSNLSSSKEWEPENFDKDDKERDLNKLDTEELDRVKSSMDVEFNKNKIRPGDENYEYDRRMVFNGPKEESGWDSE
eukprot:gb/GECH01008624.1/.p1 GENE.gb/GECH01008624.1/~~gb/GECH01008624.1/.p1  ORF type:complete len:236 (+),score=71.47 gb/GECH01008624.1/:1-708(+)